jgi:nucleotide-binding universal stress UspA family protein
VFKSILIPTDFSPSAWKAMRLGLELAHLYGAAATVLHVYPAVTHVAHDTPKELFDQLDKVRTNMEVITQELTVDQSVDTISVVVAGNVHETLLDFVQKNEFDLVIMGANSHGSDNSPGKHTQVVMEQTKIPVLVVPTNFDLDE